MVEGLLAKQEKPSNTEVLGELINSEKLDFITNLTDRNVKGYFKLGYWLDRLSNPDKDPALILQENIEKTKAYKCAVAKKNGNRSDQIVDALKHIIEDENKDDVKSLVQQIKS